MLHTRTTIAIALISLSGSCFATDNASKCPTELVNFWQKFAQKAADVQTMPSFLVINHCISDKASTAFYQATQQRFDQPQDEKLVDELYTELSWSNGYQY